MAGVTTYLLTKEKTMQRVIPKIRLLTYQQSPESGTEVMALILEHKENNYHLSGGTGDIIHVFTSGAAIYVLVIDKTNSTIRLSSFMTPEPDCINHFALHNNNHIREYLGNKWENMKPEAITIKLIQYLY